MTPLISVLAGDAEIEALLSDEAQLAAMLRFERALALASAKVGWIGDDAAQSVVGAVERFQPDWPVLIEGMGRDGVVIPALVKQLRQNVSEPDRSALHKGATSQDVIDTALVMQIAQVLDVLQARLAALITKLGEMRAEVGNKPVMAHTRMQAALPTSWDAKIASWTEPLQRHSNTFERLRDSVLVVQLGGPVGDRASFGGHGDALAAALARELGLGIAGPWQAARDQIVEFGDTLARLTGTLGKLGTDITLLAQTEVAAIRLEGGGGSSAMAHKSNPVRAEVLVALGRFNAGLAGTLQQAMLHEYERSGAAWMLEWLVLPQMMVTGGAALAQASALLGQVRVES